MVSLFFTALVSPTSVYTESTRASNALNLSHAPYVHECCLTKVGHFEDSACQLHNNRENHDYGCNHTQWVDAITESALSYNTPSRRSGIAVNSEGTFGS